MENGYRCIEIDIWNGKSGEPIVTHGRTLTKNYSLYKIVNFLSKEAFMKTSFPLIISLEMHCNNYQRNKVSEILKEKFKDKLLIIGKDSIKKPYTLS